MSYTYDKPSKTEPYPHGYSHDLSLITDPDLPNVGSPPGYPEVTGWADYRAGLDGTLPVFTVAHHASFPNWRMYEGVVDPTRLQRSVALGTAYRWDRAKEEQGTAILWYTEPGLTSLTGWSGAPLCVGHPQDPTARALVFQNFQSTMLLPCAGGDPLIVLVKGEFVLPADIKNSAIISVRPEGERSHFNTLPTRPRESYEGSPQRHGFSAV